MATIGWCCSAGQGFSSRSFPGTSKTFNRMLELGQGRGMQRPACRSRGAICVEPAKMENRLIFLCRDLAGAGVLGGKLAFMATRPFLKIKDCCGEEDLPDKMGQQHLCQPDEEREGITWEVRTPYMRMQNGSYKRLLRKSKAWQKAPV